MKKIKWIVVSAFFISAQLAIGQEKEFIFTGNPIVRDIYTADPSAHVWTIDGKERLFVYPSHDMDPPRGCDLMDKYHVYSTEDMVHWTDHGQILEAADVPWAQPLENNGKFMWAPDCVYKNGKYYFYFPKPKQDPWNDTWHIGIAVSDQPASDFTVLPEPLKGTTVSWVQNGSTVTAPGLIDPCVFIDDDGQVYFYMGGGNQCFGGKLKDNMIEVDGELQAMTDAQGKALPSFHEGTWVFKKDNVYYLTYADNNSSGGGNQLRYAISDNPLGPWTHKGIYLKPTGCDTSHGSVVEYRGQWYAFYHNAQLSGTGLLRSICVDSLYFNEDGTIREVKQTRDTGTPFENTYPTAPGIVEAEDFNDGGQGIAYWDNTRGNSYRMYRPNEWVDIDETYSGTVYVTSTEKGEFIHYFVEVQESGNYVIDFKIGTISRDSEVRFYLEYDREKVTNPRRYLAVYGSTSDLPTVTTNSVHLTKGIHLITFYPEGNLNFDKFELRFESVGIETTTENPVAVYPNPVRDLCTIQAPQRGFIRMLDLSGKEILSENMQHTTHTIDLSKRSPGMYILSLQLNDRVYQQKIIKK